MPLHLLSKKSWNVYAPDNIARVQRDKAEAQVREEEEDRQLQEQDSAARLAVLRGERRAPLAQDDPSSKNALDLGSKHSSSHDRRKRRRLHGEDDTDRDLRLAREDLELKHTRTDRDGIAKRAQRSVDIPIVDRKGHINLFPEDTQKRKQVEPKNRKAQEKQEQDDLYMMRFSNAAGRNADKNGPWYASSKRLRREDMEFVEGKDVWGKPDPSAKEREQSRQAGNDPLAIMSRAQSQLKKAERDKQSWKDEEQNRLGRHDRHEHTDSRRRRHSTERQRRTRHHKDRDSSKPPEHSDRRTHRRKSDYHSPRKSPNKSNGHGGQSRAHLPDVPDDFRLDG